MIEHVDVLIIGAGISGIGMGCRLRMDHPDRTFAILEARAAIGGTWDLFRYPGVRSDSDMYTFGYEFRPWTADDDIASGEAIRRYLADTVDEYQLRRHIRFGHRVAKLAWSSADRRWLVTGRRDDGSAFAIACTFLVTCTGYYNYASGHRPDFEGIADYRGTVVHPQHWPEDLDVTGKRVVVIGSGATAVSLVPALAATAAHVTMLQRTPTYVVSRPASDRVAVALKRHLAAPVAHRLARWKNVLLGTAFYRYARARPDAVRGWLRGMTARALGPAVAIDPHFDPPYDPWDQRLCLIPDGDLFESLRTGAASIETATIRRFTETGLELTSGRTLAADIVVTATGLELQFLGGALLEVDGRELPAHDLVTYRGLMFAGVPNWVSVMGYTTASWTLKADLSARFVSRLLAFMDARGHDVAVPARTDDGPTEPLMARLSSGYVRRGRDRMPRQGTAMPWRNRDNYVVDHFDLRYGRIDDGTLQFSSRRAPHHFAGGSEVARRGAGELAAARVVDRRA